MRKSAILLTVLILSIPCDGGTSDPNLPITLDYNAQTYAYAYAQTLGYVGYATDSDTDSDSSSNDKSESLAQALADYSPLPGWEVEWQKSNMHADVEGIYDPVGAWIVSSLDGWGEWYWFSEIMPGFDTGPGGGTGNGYTSLSGTMEIGIFENCPEGACGVILSLDATLTGNTPGSWDNWDWYLNVWDTDPCNPLVVLNDTNVSAELNVVAGQIFNIELYHEAEEDAYWPEAGLDSTLTIDLTVEPVPANLDNDLDVDCADFSIFYSHWQEDTRELYEPNEVGWWEFDEGTGSTAYDSSVYGNDGTLVNDPCWVTGHTGSAIDFDGSDDYVEITGYQGITGTDSRTCAAWIKTSSTAGSIISWGDANVTGNKWFLRVYSTGQLRIEVQGGYKVSSTIINDGNWNHFAAVLVNDGSPDVDEVKLYINGTEETVYSSVSSQAINTASGTNVSIGAALFGGSIITPFDGKIDDVRIYDFALTDEMIEQIYQGQQPSGLVCLEKSVGDFDGNCIVDLSDFLIFIQEWLWP